MTRAALLCPGRGSYTEATLGSLPPDDELVRRAEELRAGFDLEPLLALDGAARFEPARHLRPAETRHSGTVAVSTGAAGPTWEAGGAVLVRRGGALVVCSV